MGLLSFFKKTVTNIFISENDNKKLDVASGKVDYILSRALYASIPTQDSSYLDYALGNYSIKTYIDTLSSHISIPFITCKNASFANDINSFIERNKSIFLNITKQAMIDGLCYVWVRLEKTESGKPSPTLKIIPRENVKSVCRAKTGRIEKLVIMWDERWQQDIEEGGESVKDRVGWEKATIKVVLKPFHEEWEVIGDKLPPTYKQRKEVFNTGIEYISVYEIFNNKLTFLDDGVPEVAPLLPFIKKYNKFFEKIDVHLCRILEPKLKLKLKSATSFLKNSLGIREQDFSRIEKGEYKPDVTQIKVAILSDKDEDASFIQQENNVNSALAVLNLIHWIIVELTMPEYLYGTALNTTNASVKEQSPVWLKKIEDRRCEYSTFYYWLSQVFVDYAIVSRGWEVYKDFSINDVSVEWEEMQAKDDLALMNAVKTFTDATIQLMDNGIISPETAFNTLKNFISIPNEWNVEREKAIEHIREKAEWEEMQRGGII